MYITLQIYQLSITYKHHNNSYKTRRKFCVTHTHTHTHSHTCTYTDAEKKKKFEVHRAEVNNESSIPLYPPLCAVVDFSRGWLGLGAGGAAGFSDLSSSSASSFVPCVEYIVCAVVLYYIVCAVSRSAVATPYIGIEQEKKWRPVHRV